ncbi:MAG: HD domain-containing protein [Lachnospiraceae bacterium]|nr:HD domain-containing protein [Lachnospiraceae bacterium]
MFELIRDSQLNIMLLLCGACAILVFLLFNTRFLSKSRKKILIFMELLALFLLWFDRQAYIYSGVVSRKGYVMVRLSNFSVFFLTSAIVFGFNLYISDLLMNEGKSTSLPRRLILCGGMSVVGMILAVISAFTGLYYYIDEINVYHRGHGFLIAYIIPVVCPLLQYTVIRQYKKAFSRLIYVSLVLYIFVPIICGILQIYAYGISIVNMAMVCVSVFLYVFMYLDLNNTVEHAHEIEIENIQGEQAHMRRLFEQTATAFVSAVEKKDEYTKGHALKIAEYSKRMASLAGKSDEECEEVYYAALLHDVGLIGIPDKVVINDADPDPETENLLKQKPVIGDEILSSITEYPYLCRGARYSHERYDGTGYPEGLKGEEIPEIARIIGIADAYVTMTSPKRYRDARPVFLARESIIKGSGTEFDPAYAKLMVSIIDSDTNKKNQKKTLMLEKEIECHGYREVVSTGIPIENKAISVSFDCEMPLDVVHPFAAPSIVLFDSFDGRCHDNEKTIEDAHYLEYGEVWFDKYSITTAARKIEETRLEDGPDDRFFANGSRCEIVAGRFEDHLRLLMRSDNYAKEVIVALPNKTNAAYIGLTGENCRLSHITVHPTGDTIGAGDIPRIVESVNYIDHLEADVPNVQVDTARSAYTQGVEIKGVMRLAFNTMSLPGAELIWHCPYIVIYSSTDGRVGGDDYREYAMIKLNGENNEIEDVASNRFVMKRTADFTGWDNWRDANRKGMEVEILFERKGNRITLETVNAGISISNVTTIKEDVPKVYVALSGDQVALTDIRIQKL